MKCLVYLGWGVLTYLHVNCIDYHVGRVLVHPLFLMLCLFVGRIEKEDPNN